MLNEATKQNIERKGHWADRLQLMDDGTPLFSWLDLSVTELCNRSAGAPNACTFCPRIDPAGYPNQALHMGTDLGRLMAEELHDLRYKGAIVLCGFGEPLLHPKLEEFIRPFKGLRVEVVTNGDRLTRDRANALYEAGASYILVSMYDGPHQVDKFKEVFDGLPNHLYAMRDRWHGPDDDFGLKLTNRAGTIDVGEQAPVDTDAQCFYPSYSLAVDWNGDALLCVQDWNKKLKFGNINNTSLLDVWKNKQLHKRRMQLIKGERKSSPCSSCNAEGTCHGAAHAEAWEAK